jgi:hypothetical protein
MKPLISRLKLYLRWIILGATFFFLGKVLKDNWQQVAAIRVEVRGWMWLAIALGTTLLAHVCAGWVWSLILQAFKQSITPIWAIQTYLKTNIASIYPEMSGISMVELLLQPESGLLWKLQRSVFCWNLY